MNNNQVIIEHTARHDLKDIVGIAQRIEWFTPEEVSCLATDIENQFADASSLDQMLTLKIGPRTVGFCHYGPLPITDRTWMMFWILVDPAEQANGFGQQIMAAMERHIADENGRMILIETSDDDGFARSRRFSERAGYSQVATIHKYYSNNISKCLFSKSLAGR